jgi:hypothetical protein
MFEIAKVHQLVTCEEISRGDKNKEGLIPTPAEIVRPAFTTAAKGSVESEKTLMPTKMNKRNRKRMMEDPINADTMFLVDKPSSSLQRTYQRARFARLFLDMK